MCSQKLAPAAADASQPPSIRCPVWWRYTRQLMRALLISRPAIATSLRPLLVDISLKSDLCFARPHTSAKLIRSASAWTE